MVSESFYNSQARYWVGGHHNFISVFSTAVHRIAASRSLKVFAAVCGGEVATAQRGGQGQLLSKRVVIGGKNYGPMLENYGALQRQ